MMFLFWSWVQLKKRLLNIVITPPPPNLILPTLFDFDFVAVTLSI